jgi:NADH-quinone oxidoreductase subunit L
MVQAIVFLPLLGAILAGLIAIYGAHARNPGGDEVKHHDHGHGAHAHAADAHDEHAHDDHAHDDHHVSEPAAQGSRAAELITTGLLFVSAALSWITLVDVGFMHHDARIALFPWINSGDLQVSWALRVDTLTAVMLVEVNTVSSLVHLYSIGYMDEDPYRPRFFAYLSLFTFAMLMLVTADNLVQLFFGWEGVGLASYLLIGFWYQKPSANAAAIKAFVVNRVGDFGFALGIFAIFMLLKSTDFETIFAGAPGLSGKTIDFFGWHADALTLTCLLLFMGAMGKSAQFLLHTWLPDAMEGPTPVSALIHAATMVTAGVYMIGRNAVLFEHAPQTMMIVAVIGALTALMAGTIGLVQNDIKRVLAYSTVSQLGYMFLAMGVGAFGAGIFHLYTHAFFKALLFLGSGAVIHALHGEQDIRNMGGLKKELPITFWTFVIGAVAIAGIPPLAGFFSKDEILFETFVEGHVALWVIGALTALLTAAYMFRLVFLTFWGERRHDAPVAHGHDHGHGAAHRDGHLHDAPPAMALALIVLAIGSVAAGWIGIPHAVGGHNQLHAWLEPAFEAPRAATETAAPATEAAAESHESLELALMAVSSVIAVAGIWFAYIVWVKRRSIAENAAREFPAIHRLLLNKYYVDELYDAAIVQPIRVASQEGLWRGFDVKIIDGAVNGTGAIVNGSATWLRRLQTGSVKTYAGSLFVGVVIILGYYLWRP